MNQIKIGNKTIGDNYPVYVIAEIGLNHQGDILLAKKLVDIAADAGADAVKFQKRSMKHLYKKDVFENSQLQERGLAYSMKHVMQCELTNDEMADLRNYSKEKGVDFICTPWEEESLQFLHTLNMPAYKIGSPDMLNFPLIRKIILTKKPLIISTGMSYVSEIDQLVRFLDEGNAQYILMHCVSSYPAAFHDLNLNFIPELKRKSSYPVGYSGHEHGIVATLAAVTLGARVVERHLTLDKKMPGPDHRASLEPEEFKELVRQIRIVESSLGEPTRFPSRGEFLNRENLSKSLIVRRPIQRGEILRYEDIGVKSPGQGTKPFKLDYFIGKTVTARDLTEEDYLLESDVDSYEPPKVDASTINHKWGVVVRMRDIDELLHCCPSYVEMHLTDDDIKINKPHTKEYDKDLIVHCPEYDGDLLLDLSSLDADVRERSIQFYNIALEHSRGIKKLFRNRNERVKFVAHPGGFGTMRPLLESIDQLNANFADSLGRLHADGFELLVENMPSCPWCFGGQWFHSSFMDPEEIARFSRETGYGVVLDVSHAALYCNYYKKNLEEFVKTLLPVTKHLHISDAAGFNGEGLKIGAGTIDFKTILPHLLKTDLTFTMEIWQGHKFGGEDFVGAVKALKAIDPNF